MTNREAIKKLKDCTIFANGMSSHKAIDIAIDALEKQIPKQLQSRSAGSCFCGQCHSMFPEQLYGVGIHYCPWCGQMIKTEENVEKTLSGYYSESDASQRRKSNRECVGCVHEHGRLMECLNCSRIYPTLCSIDMYEKEKGNG